MRDQADGVAGRGRSKNVDDANRHGLSALFSSVPRLPSVVNITANLGTVPFTIEGSPVFLATVVKVFVAAAAIGVITVGEGERRGFGGKKHLALEGSCCITGAEGRQYGY